MHTNESRENRLHMSGKKEDEKFNWIYSNCLSPSKISTPILKMCDFNFISFLGYKSSIYFAVIVNFYINLFLTFPEVKDEFHGYKKKMFWLPVQKYFEFDQLINDDMICKSVIMSTLALRCLNSNNKSPRDNDLVYTPKL